MPSMTLRLPFSPRPRKNKKEITSSLETTRSTEDTTDEEEEEEGFLSYKEVPRTTIPASSTDKKSEGTRVKDMDKNVRRSGRKSNKEIRWGKTEKKTKSWASNTPSLVS